MIKIATWNVNSVKARGEHVARWLAANPVDLLCLQELKCETAHFPAQEFESQGYFSAVHGQKAYNGVAILGREPLPDFEIPAFHDESRILVTTYKNIDVINVYAVNGNPAPGEKFDKKMMWLRKLAELLKKKRAADRDVVLLGDFNIIPTPLDAAFPQNWVNDALYLPESKALYREMLYLGYTDAWRALHPREPGYTFWDYQGGSWERNNGIRIDHVLLSPRLADRLESCEIDSAPRGWDKPSDHVPVIVTLKD